MRSITRATIGFFVAAGLSGAIAVVLHLLGSQAAELLGGVLGSTIPGTAIVITAWVLTVAAALLLYHGLMRAASEQDAAAERRAQELAAWRSRRQPGPPASLP